MRTAWRIPIEWLMTALLVPLTLSAQQTSRPPLDFSSPIPSDTSVPGTPRSVVEDAVNRYNSAGLRATGSFASGNDISGNVGFHLGPALLSGSITGDIVMINGDLRLAATARVSGRVLVLGGHLTVDSGAVTGATTVWPAWAPVVERRDLTLQIRQTSGVLTDLTAASWSSEAVELSARFSLAPFNRIEQLPLRLATTATWQPGSSETLRLDLTGIARTATVPDMQPRSFGWYAGVSLDSRRILPITLSLAADNQLAATRDQIFPGSEPGLNALFFRRDRQDWYWNRSQTASLTVRPFPRLSLSSSLQSSRESSVREGDAFSIFRSSESWRINPAIDNGRYHTVTLGAQWDSRDDDHTPTTGLYLRGEFRRVTSSNFSAVALPTTIRGELSGGSYQSDQLDLDARLYHRLNPSRSVHLRLAVGGWLGGDPLTLQHRRAFGGPEPSGGHSFRAVNCDNRRLPDPALPALCDRQVLAQVEFRQALSQDFTTRLANRELGFKHPDLLLFLDVGSAWLAGDGEGRVPSNRLQTPAEWRSSVGLGLDAGNLGLYLSKALSDSDPVRIFLTFRPRF